MAISAADNMTFNLQSNVPLAWQWLISCQHKVALSIPLSYDRVLCYR